MADDTSWPTISRRQAISGAMAAGSAAAAAAQQTPPASVRGAAGPTTEQVSVLDFGADPTGRNDSSQAFRRALQELNGGRLNVPRGRYLAERIGGLGPAGQQIVGESRWNTIFATETGAGPLFHNQAADRGTSAFHLLSDFMVDLNGTDGTGVDLASINCTTVQRLHVKGGSATRRRGIGLRFAAPIERGAYDNAVYDCSFEYLDRGVVWDDGANNNAISSCRIINCRVGIDAAPAKPVDTPRVFGGRVEGCDYGLLEGAEYGAYFAVRFEDNRLADIRFTERSRNAGFWGGLTATTQLTIMDLDRAISPSIDSGDLGYLAIEESNAQPKISTGRHVFGAAGKAPEVHPLRDYAAQFGDYVLFSNEAAVEFSTAAGDAAIIGMQATATDELSIPAYNRQTRTYSSISFGGGPTIRPPNDGVTDLGAPGRAYKRLHLSEGVYVGGHRLLGERQTAIADDASSSATATTVNRILAAMRRLGLIAE